MEALLTALGNITSLGAEYARADNTRRQAILDELDANYRSYRESLAGLPAAHKANENAFLNAVAALPDEAPAAQPTPAAPATSPAPAPATNTTP